MFNRPHYWTFSCQFSLLSVCLGYYSDRGPSFSWRMLWSWHHLAPISPIAGCWVKIAAHSSYFICRALPPAPVISLDYNKKLEILSGIKFSLHPFSLELYRYNNKALRHERSSRVKLCNYFIQILVIFISQDNHSSLYWIPNIIIITEHLFTVLLSFPLNAEKLHI